MRRKIGEDALKEERASFLSEKREYANRLVEKWSKKKNLGEGMEDMAPAKARKLSVILENQERHLKNLTEAQISGDFSTTPHNVIRVVRLGYPNSVRGEIFDEVSMVTARDAVYYLKPTYESTARGATAANVTHENASYRYASEIEEDSLGTGDGSTTNFTTTLSNPPLRNYTVVVYNDNIPVGSDNGSGSITGTTISIGTVNVTTGAVDITFSTAPTSGNALVVRYQFDSEVTAQHTDIKAVKLTLTDYQLRAQPWPLYVSWSKMSELLLSTTLDIDAEEALITGAADELKKSLDFQAVRLGYRYARGNTAVTFDADFASAGSDSEVAHAQSVTKTIKQGANVVYNALQRGGINVLVAGTGVAAFLTLHSQFTTEGIQPEVGIHRIGTLLGKPVYQAPNSIVPAGEMLGVWKNTNEAEDVSIIFGTLIPLYQTQTLEYKYAYSETGLFHFGDHKVLQSSYLVKFVFSNL
jgi:hypothetical protein